MENKQTTKLERLSQRILALPYTARLSLMFLAFAISVMISSVFISWMVKPAVWITLICIGAIYGIFLFVEETKKNKRDEFEIIGNLIKGYSSLAIGIMMLPFFFSWMGTVANSIFLICIGVVYTLFFLERHLKKNLVGESLKIDDANGFKYVEGATSGKVDWKKIRRIALVTVLIISPMYFFADYQRNHTENMLKTKTSK